MASLDSVQTRQILATGISIFAGTDLAVALRLRYVGTGTVTSVTTVTATDLVLITSDGGTDTYTFAAYTTMGALADAINADGIFEARVLDVLRSDASDNNLLAEALTTSTTDENGNAVYDVKVDTSGMFYVGACLSGTRGFDSRAEGHRVRLQGIDYVANMGTAAADQLRVYARKASDQTQERLVWAGLSVDTTATAVLFANGQGTVDSRNGEELVVRIKDAASLADGGYMKASGKFE
jgi:hypothetical protein